MKKLKPMGRYGSVFTIVVLAAVGVLLLWGWFGTGIIAGEDSVEISGLHGKDISYSEISSAGLRSELPTITAKTGGYSLAGKRLGNFTTLEYGLLKLYLQNNTPPFIFIETKEGKIVILNMKDSVETKEIFNEITEKYMGDIFKEESEN